MTSTPSWLRSACDPRAVSAELMVVLVLAIGFRHPITHAIGTAGDPVPAVRMNNAPAAISNEPYVDLPRSSDYALPDVSTDESPATPVQPIALPKAAPVRAVHAVHAPAVRPAAPSKTTYRVRHGDSLWRIAERRVNHPKDVAAVARLTHQIYVANKATIGSDPSQLPVGVSLTLV